MRSAARAGDRRAAFYLCHSSRLYPAPVGAIILGN